MRKYAMSPFTAVLPHTYTVEMLKSRDAHSGQYFHLSRD